MHYDNVVALGEFLLGYPNEYDCYTERPLLSPGGVNDLLAPAENDASKRDLGRNGTYLVLRDLLQDVRGFWSYAKTETLASAFVGRRQNGDPLVPAGATQNDFTFAGDPDGIRCPFGAHIRRANPRNADFPTAPSGPIGTALAMLGFQKTAFHDDLTSSVRFHRILRRGREFGPALSPAQATLPPPADDPLRGLRFVGLNANIGRQFEFLQNAWLASSSFNGLIGESDPLLGNREPGLDGGPTDTFVMNRPNAARTRLSEVPRFVTVTGGVYFFLPSLSALRYISHARRGGDAMSRPTFLSLTLAIVAFSACSGGTRTWPDEAKMAGRTPALFVAADEDYFHGMDGNVQYTPDEIKGRDTWLVWTGGNDVLWDRLSTISFGNLDLLKILSSYPTLATRRSNRWETLGVVNEPCFKEATGPNPDRFGLWLDVRVKSSTCAVDPFENEKKYPGVAIGARGTTIPVGSYYGYASGVVGLRLFPNPAFDERAAKAWDPKRYYSDSSYYLSDKLIRPYRVGMSCGFCHVGPSPIDPPADPNNPTWSNFELYRRCAVHLGRSHLRLAPARRRLHHAAFQDVAAGDARHLVRLDR